MSHPDPASDGSSFPPGVSLDVSLVGEHSAGGSLLDYWHQRLAQHTQDSYAGVSLSKFPEDLRVYEHLLWDQSPDAVVEIGSQFGASALWFRDRLVALRNYRPSDFPVRVVAVDIEASSTAASLQKADPNWRKTITLIDGDVRDAAVAERVRDALPEGASVFVVEDSAHEFDTTYSALEHYSDLVPINGYFVVEDGCVDLEALRGDEGWPRGVLPAIDDWLQTNAGQSFERRRDLEIYGITCHPKGFLRRIR